ncbi:MAG: phosphatase PAP2 family protein [Patescibacteria group bacterium]|nr:phosphatase PAP2 family protein [Patescibacteria group bacterium]MDE2015434.1 phosphatase PAP2 family protein [Patescibacteria group bacterium]MDE2226951.1 phosphatase PAP2 family protein [Patescibacteria group bacterium]
MEDECLIWESRCLGGGEPTLTKFKKSIEKPYFLFSSSPQIGSNPVRRGSAILFLLALLIGFARVYSGIHHPVDIAGSVLIIIAAGLTCYFVFNKRQRPI